MSDLALHKRISFETSCADPKLSTDYLFGQARGQMFGVLVCRNVSGVLGTVKAFSGQYDGLWQVPGWAPPLFDLTKMEALCRDVEPEIKALGKQIERDALDATKLRNLRRQRRQLSQDLMKEIHALYTITNFKGENAPLVEIFQGPGKGIPTGAGDCCAPKLLNYAALHNLHPIGLAEFFWGLENRSQTKQHRMFYNACAEKCQPLLGFMLCGLLATRLSA